MATKVTKTIGSGTGDDYATLAALAADDQDLVTADEYWEVTCSNFQDTGTGCDFAGWTTSATCYLHVKAADKHASGGQITSNAYRLVVNSTGAAIRVSGTHIGNGGLLIFEGIQVSNTNAGTGAHGYSDITSSDDFTVRFVDCIFNDAYYNWNCSGHGNLELINCIGLGSGRAIYCDDADGLIKVYHCTLRGTAYGIALNAATTATVKNTYLSGGTSSIQVWSGTLNQTKVATDDADSDETALDNIAYSTANFVNVTGGTEDLRLVVGSGLLQVGADISGESAPFNVSVDLEADGRNTASPDIGADEKDAVSASASHNLFILGF